MTAISGSLANFVYLVPKCINRGRHRRGSAIELENIMSKRRMAAAWKYETKGGKERVHHVEDCPNKTPAI